MPDARRFSNGPDLEIAGTISTSTNATVSPAADILPQRLAYNTIRLERLVAGSYTLRVLGSPTGTRATPSEFGAILAAKTNDGTTYERMSFENLEGRLDVDVRGDETSLALIVAAIGAGVCGEVFAYEYGLFDREEQDPDEVDDTTGGCNSSMSSSNSLVALAFAILGMGLFRRHLGLQA